MKLLIATGGNLYLVALCIAAYGVRAMMNDNYQRGGIAVAVALVVVGVRYLWGRNPTAEEIAELEKLKQLQKKDASKPVDSSLPRP